MRSVRCHVQAAWQVPDLARSKHRRHAGRATHRRQFIFGGYLTIQWRRPERGVSSLFVPGILLTTPLFQSSERRVEEVPISQISTPYARNRVSR